MTHSIYGPSVCKLLPVASIFTTAVSLLFVSFVSSTNCPSSLRVLWASAVKVCGCISVLDKIGSRIADTCNRILTNFFAYISSVNRETFIAVTDVPNTDCGERNAFYDAYVRVCVCVRRYAFRGKQKVSQRA